MYDRLQQEFGADNVFIDVDTLLPGDDFVDAIGNTLGQCNLMIALIGPNWLTAADEHGRRRLDDPADFVRIEIQTALERRIRTVPVLVNHALMPQEHQLPDALKPLIRRQAAELTDTRWASDIGALVEKIKRAAGAPSVTEPPRASSTPVTPSHDSIPREPTRGSSLPRWIPWAGAAALGLGTLGVVAVVLNRPHAPVAPLHETSVVPPKPVVPESKTDVVIDQPRTSPATPLKRAAAPSPRRSVPPAAETPAVAREPQPATHTAKRPVDPCRDGESDAGHCVQACDAGDARSCANLGRMYEQGTGGLTKDAVRAFALFQKACDAGDANGCNALGVGYDHGDGSLPRDVFRAVALYQKACDAGNAVACANAGNVYMRGGAGPPKDPVRAASFYQKACDGGNAIGCRHLGNRYAKGDGLAIDLVRAAEFFRKACAGGDKEACDSLAKLR